MSSARAIRLRPEGGGPGLDRLARYRRSLAALPPNRAVFEVLDLIERDLEARVFTSSAASLERDSTRS